MFQTSNKGGRSLLPPSQKEGYPMKLFMENGYYEVVYENEHYKFLEFIRLDTIQDKTYVTLKNVITGEMITFDENKIVKITKKLFSVQNKVAIYRAYSL